MHKELFPEPIKIAFFILLQMRNYSIDRISSDFRAQMSLIN